MAPGRVPVRARGSGDRSVVTLLAAAALLVALLVGRSLWGSGRQIQPVIDPRAPLGVDRPVADGIPGAARVHRLAGRLHQGRTAASGGHRRRPSRSLLRHAGPGSRTTTAGPGSSRRMRRTEALVAWSPDGSHCSTRTCSGHGADGRCGNGSARRHVDTLCDPRCTGIEGFAFSPDGARLAFAAGRSPESGPTSVIAILDLATGRVIELASTATTNDGLFCDSRRTRARTTRRYGHRTGPGWCSLGRSSGRVARTGSASQSCCGSRRRDRPAGPRPGGAPPAGPAVVARRLGDRLPHGVRRRRRRSGSSRPLQRSSGGTGLVRLTTGGGSSGPSGRETAAWSSSAGSTRADLVQSCGPWTPTGVARRDCPTILADLTAVGCIRCLYPPDDLTEAIWQPTP